MDNVVDLFGTLGKGLLDLLGGRVSSCTRASADVQYAIVLAAIAK